MYASFESLYSKSETNIPLYDNLLELKEKLKEKKLLQDTKEGLTEVVAVELNRCA